MRKRRVKKREKSQLILVFTVVLVSLVIIGVTIVDLLRIIKTQREIEKLQVNIERLEKEAKELRQQVGWLKTHKEELEPFAKDALEVQRSDERVVVVVEK